MEAVEFGTFVNNGMIEIPAEYRKDYFADIRVILLKNKSKQDDAEPPYGGVKSIPIGKRPEGTYSKDFNIQERVAAAERLVGIASREAMTLEDIRNERLARQ
jgi:hypothetical protein